MSARVLVVFLFLVGCASDGVAFVPRDAGGDAPPPVPAGWLYTRGNHIYRDGSIWVGRGVNLADLHRCGRDIPLADMPLAVAELTERIDVLVRDWHATLVRINLTADDGSNFLNNPSFAAHMVEVLEHIEAQPNLFVLVALYGDPTFTDGPGACCPQTSTLAVYEAMVRATGHLSHVLYGLSNEPAFDADTAEEAALVTLFEQAVQTIRDTEADLGVPSHLVSVQSTRGWGRFPTYYLEHPITTGGGQGIVYEVHPYEFPESYDAMFVTASATLPLLFGQFGPYENAGRTQDYVDLMMRADALSIPYTAWIYDWDCGFALISDASLTPTPYGIQVRDHIAALGP